MSASSHVRDVSESSTRCPSDAFSDDLASDTSSPNHRRMLPIWREGGVIIFDWDDTLFPTSFLREHNKGRSLSFRKHFREELTAHAKLVEETLRVACGIAKVAIVTLAKPGWVTHLADEYLPNLHIKELLAELDVEVFYARLEDCPGAFEAGRFELLKASAMRKIIEDFNKDHCGRGCPSALSIGDDTIERDALKGLLADNHNFVVNPFCKTVKLPDEPSLWQLSEQLQRFSPFLRSMSTLQRDFDIRADHPGMLTCLCEDL